MKDDISKSITSKKAESKKRRDNGTGTLKQLNNGNWEGAEKIRKKSGGVIRKSVTRTSKTEVIQIKNQLKALEPLDDDVIYIDVNKITNEITVVRDGEKILRKKGNKKDKNIEEDNKIEILHKKVNIDKDTLVKDYVDYWLFTYRKNGVVTNTFCDYVDKCRHIKNEIGNKKVSELNFQTLEKMVLKLNTEKAYNTAIQVKNHLTNMVKYACYEDKILEEDPFIIRKIRLTQTKERKKKYILSRKDEDRFIKKCIQVDDDELLVALYSGGRGSELRGLTWECILFEESSIDIDHQYMNLKYYDYIEGELKIVKRSKEITELKTEASYRTLCMPKEVMERLAILKEKQKTLAESLGIGFKNTDFVFTNEKYQPRGKNYIATKLNRTLEELKVKNWDKITPHNLRHNYCTRGIENKVSLPEMQRLLGHEKISVTDEWYTHLDKEYLKNSAKNVNNNRLSAFRKDKEHITPKRKFFIRRKNHVSTY